MLTYYQRGYRVLNTQSDDKEIYQDVTTFFFNEQMNEIFLHMFCLVSLQMFKIQFTKFRKMLVKRIGRAHLNQNLRNLVLKA